MKCFQGGVTTRACSTKGLCALSNIKDCSECDTDLCNSGTSFGPIGMMIAIPASYQIIRGARLMIYFFMHFAQKIVLDQIK